MNEVNYKEIDAEEAGQRLDNYLMRILKGVPKSCIYRIIRSGEVRVNKKRAAVSLHLQAGDLVRIPPIRTAEASPVFVGKALSNALLERIVFEDAHLIVINKPSGLAVHGGSGLNLGLIEALRKIRSDLPYLELVHRLDKETSGCLLIAKKRSYLRAIQALLTARQVNKTYWALVTAAWTGPKQRIINTPLQKNILKSGERMVTVHNEGKPSETELRLLENYQASCLVAASPKTGRTHQIRVHCASIGHGILGDEKYGVLAAEVEGMDNQTNRLYLHAKEIQFELNGTIHHFQAALDKPFNEALKQLRARSAASNE